MLNTLLENMSHMKCWLGTKHLPEHFYLHSLTESSWSSMNETSSVFYPPFNKVENEAEMWRKMAKVMQLVSSIVWQQPQPLLTFKNILRIIMLICRLPNILQVILQYFIPGLTVIHVEPLEKAEPKLGELKLLRSKHQENRRVVAIWDRCPGKGSLDAEFLGKSEMNCT